MQKNILELMASNGLVANPSKTVLMRLNSKKHRNNGTMKITVSNPQVLKSKSTKLCGKVMDNDRKWKSHYSEKGGLLSSLKRGYSYSKDCQTAETRSTTRGDLTEVGRSTKAKKSFACEKRHLRR